MTTNNQKQSSDSKSHKKLISKVKLLNLKSE